MRVADLMTKKVAFVRTSDQLSTAAKLMWDCDCGALPVLDQDDRVQGMITDRDICMACWMQSKPPGELQVSAVKSRDLFFCSPQDSVRAAESLMRSKQIRRIPIVNEQHHLLGILSLADIVREEERERVREQQAEVSSDEVASTLATICQNGRAHVHPSA